MDAIKIKTKLDEKIHQNSATSPLSDIKTPTISEAKKGDYEKAKIKISGLKIEIENPYGSVRKGVDKDGNKWECELKDSYGEISSTEGADGDPIDVFVKPHLTQQQADSLESVFVIDQINPQSGKFDEHKVIFGYDSKDNAIKSYLSNYAKDWQGLGEITEMSMIDFKRWLKKGDATKVAHKAVFDDARTEIDNLRSAISTAQTGREKLDLLKQFVALKPRLAPNGKPSKLNAMQHTQVRTPEFKAWFGDFEAAATIKELATESPVKISGTEIDDFVEPLDMKQLRKKVYQYGVDNLVGDYVNQRSGIKLEIRNNGIDQAIQHGSAPDKLKAFAAIKEVVKNGFVVYNGENPKNNKGKLVVISKHVDIASKQYVVTAGFREDANGRLFYDHEMLDIRRVEGLLSQSSEGQMPRHPAPASPRLNDYYTKFINQNIDYSKVIDSNGEPLVVYHGTDADIAEFATEKAGENGIGAGLGSFFTDNADYASEYAEKLGGNVIPVILSLKNPLMIDDYYGIDKITNIAFDYESNAKYGKTLEELENSENESDNEKTNDIYAIFGNPSKPDYFSVKNSQIQKTLIKMGYDGVILKGDKQSASNDDLVFIAFNSSQIKSATGNKGSFSMQANSILDSLNLQTGSEMLAQTLRNFDCETPVAPVFDKVEFSEIENIRIKILSANTGADKLALLKQFVATRSEERPLTQNPDLETFTDSDLKPEGDDNVVKTAKGLKVTTGFAVVEAKNLIVSHDNQGNENPEYPYELQPRDRKRAESVAWVLKTAKDLDVDSLGKTRRADSGAPIVGKDRVVESGNGRTMAIIEAYRIGAAEEYREWLIDEAASFGISQSKVEAMKKPVLVRVRKSKLDRVAFASDANADDKLAMTATEKARSDANRLDDALISKLIDGDLNSVQNRPFVLGFLQSLGDAEAAQYSTTSGEPTKQLFDRLQAAIFARAYSDDRLLEMMADDSKPEIKNIIAALNSAAPDFVKAKGLSEKQADYISAKLTDSIELSLDQEAIDTIIKATNAIMAAKDKGLTIEEYLAQTDLFGNGIDAVTGAMALFIKENNRSSGRLSVAFKEMASFVNKELESKQSLSLFGDSEPISLNDVLKAANDALQRQYGEQQELKGAVRKGGFIDLFTETRGKKELREKWLEEQTQTTQESENARTTNVDLESDSETPRNENSPSDGTVLNDRGTNGTESGITGEPTSGAELPQQGDIGLSEIRPDSAGIPSDSSVDGGNGELGDDSRHSDGAGSSDDGGQGIPDDRQRNSELDGAVRETEKLSREQKKQLQDDAENIAYKKGAWNIRETLPFLLPEQQDDIIKIEERFETAHGMMITNGTGTGKAQPLDAKVLTPNGWVLMGDIKPNDSVITADGTTTKVLSVHPQGEKEIYRVEFSDGAVTECCDEHLWLTQTLYERRKMRGNPNWNCAQPEVRTLKEIRETIDKQHFIPVVNSIEFNKKDFLIHGYVMGVLLGDGCFRGGSITFSTGDKQIADLVQLHLKDGYSVSAVNVSDDRCPTYRIGENDFKSQNENGGFKSSQLINALKEYGLWGADSVSKFIPTDYLMTDTNSRLNLLRGLLDTDGYVDKKTGSVYFTSVSKMLIDGIIELTRSLGGIATVSKKIPTYTHNGERKTGKLAYTACLHLPNSVQYFGLTRKLDLITPKVHAPRRKIVSVTLVGKKQAQCIAIEHPSHLYVTDDYVVTHNTYTALGAIKRFAKQGKQSILIVVPGDKIAADFIESAENLHLKIKALEDITDNGGEGIAITSYANFYQNESLMRRDWDLVIFDEAHKINSNAAGDSTGAQEMMRKITGHPSKTAGLVSEKLNNHPVKQQLDAVKQQLDAVKIKIREAGGGGGWTNMTGWTDSKKENLKALEDKEAELKQELEEAKDEIRAELEKKRAKVLFLSATPFAYEKSIDYAEGYLFDYPKSEDGGYNSGDGQQNFMMTHFGYSMRTNKLTRPDAGVNGGAMQRQFNEMLKTSGALSGRSLKVDADYSREFIILKDKLGEQIDAALSALNDSKYRELNSYIHASSFDYLSRLKLLEAIKAKSIVKRIHLHLALNRKVVVFHGYNVGGATNPFKLMTTGNVWAKKDDREKSKIQSQYADFSKNFPKYANMKLDDLQSPIETLKSAFGGDVMIYNGTVAKKQILQSAKDFNNDSLEKNIILMQTDKGKEGVSLHDTTGKKTRVLINLGLPTKPTDTIQIEGRIYRTGQVTDAIFEYISTGTKYEKRIFADVIATRSSEAENLAMGNDARNLLDAFKNGYLNANSDEPSTEQGRGGKEINKLEEISPFDKAISDYFATQKANKNTKSKGIDYFPTPEPIGMKMVEFANLKAGESALEPSAGHGAIARYMPENTKNTYIEPSLDLQGDLALRTAGNGDIKGGAFEDLSTYNKFSAVVMNPPFGKGGKMAIEHVEKATKHLRDLGRVVALIPDGGMAEKRFNQFLERAEKDNIILTKTIHLPSIAFERAGTSVNTKIVILDRIDDKETRESLYETSHDFRQVTDIKELFAQMQHLQTQRFTVLPKVEAENSVMDSVEPEKRQFTTIEKEIVLDSVAIPSKESKPRETWTLQSYLRGLR